MKVKKDKLAVQAINVALFIILIILISYVSSIFTSISNLEYDAMIFQQNQQYNSYKVFITELHNSFVSEVQEGELDPTNEGDVIRFISHYAEQAKSMNSETEFIFVNGSSRKILLPYEIRDKSYDLLKGKEGNEYISYSMNIPIMPDKKYYFVAECRIKIDSIYSAKIFDEMNKIEKNSAYTTFISISLYVICMCIVIWYRRGLERCKNDNLNLKSMQGNNRQQ
jgi:hypothetical protein